jgi:hypothetical protein
LVTSFTKATGYAIFWKYVTDVNNC